DGQAARQRVHLGLDVVLIVDRDPAASGGFDVLPGRVELRRDLVQAWLIAGQTVQRRVGVALELAARLPRRGLELRGGAPDGRIRCTGDGAARLAASSTTATVRVMRTSRGGTDRVVSGQRRRRGAGRR